MRIDLKKLSLEKTKVEREPFLRKALAPYLPSDQVERAIYSDSLGECVGMEILTKVGNE